MVWIWRRCVLPLRPALAGGATMRDFFYTDDFMWEVLNIWTLPKRLCQFTSVDSLEKIVSTRTMRFSRLDRVNDPEEAAAENLPEAASSVFVSCWTGPDIESISMWAIYGDQLRGVRLSLPSNMFRGREKPAALEEGGAVSSVDDWVTIERPLPAAGVKTRMIIGPNKVVYSDDPGYRRPRIIQRRGGRGHVFPYDLGMLKGTDWAYEDEWRFKIALMSSGPDRRWDRRTFDERRTLMEVDPYIPSIRSIKKRGLVKSVLNDGLFDLKSATIGFPRSGRKLGGGGSLESPCLAKL